MRAIVSAAVLGESVGAALNRGSSFFSVSQKLRLCDFGCRVSNLKKKSSVVLASESPPLSSVTSFGQPRHALRASSGLGPQACQSPNRSRGIWPELTAFSHHVINSQCCCRRCRRRQLTALLTASRRPPHAAPGVRASPRCSGDAPAASGVCLRHKEWGAEKKTPHRGKLPR